MKKIFSFLVIISLCLLATPVFAEEVVDCGAIANITKPAAFIIMVISPAILIVMGTIDFLGAIASSDDRAFKKAINNLVKRFVICLVILLLPTIVNMIIGWTTFRDLSACLK